MSISRLSARAFVIGLGSNLGAREVSLVRAVAEIARVAHVELAALSSVYETPPLGPPQPDYLNAAVRVQCGLSPEQLLDQLLGIEAALGRVRDVRWGPRILDLDILWSQQPYVSDRLRIPHRELQSRTFALAPLLDVAPELAPEYAGSLQELGGPPRVCGILHWDHARQSCELRGVDAL
jgi:2-amino-4-hydroxy-6-hydroxymethyldihydropteridine diphosphokinase